ncbi:hypothetical protein ACLM5J_20210 [Nocardioides sp. Bht2]|uniref:hypothetical protein n=1 Tax=Nocardioides sp. Bht2 TaxID=3392297 RepID=UPI0039B4F52C
MAEHRLRLGEKIPARWVEIPGVSQELEALRMAWASAYGEDGPLEGFGAGQWHDMLARVLGRLHDTWIADERKRKHSRGSDPSTAEPTMKLVPVAEVESSIELPGEALSAAGADEETIRSYARWFRPASSRR